MAQYKETNPQPWLWPASSGNNRMVFNFEKLRESIKQKKAEEKRTLRKRLIEQPEKAQSVALNDNTQVARANKRYNKESEEKAGKGAAAYAAWREEHPNLATWGDITTAAPLVVAAIPAAGAIGEALAGSATAQGIASTLGAAGATEIAGVPVSTWLNAGFTSLMGAGGLNDVYNGRFTPETAFNLMPLTQVIGPATKSIWRAANSTKLGKAWNISRALNKAVKSTPKINKFGFTEYPEDLGLLAKTPKYENPSEHKILSIKQNNSRGTYDIVKDDIWTSEDNPYSVPARYISTPESNWPGFKFFFNDVEHGRESLNKFLIADATKHFHKIYSDRPNYFRDYIPIGWQRGVDKYGDFIIHYGSPKNQYSIISNEDVGKIGLLRIKNENPRIYEQIIQDQTHLTGRNRMIKEAAIKQVMQEHPEFSKKEAEERLSEFLKDIDKTPQAFSLGNRNVYVHRSLDYPEVRFHEIEHSYHTPKHRVKGFDYGDKDDYFEIYNSTEAAARTGQILNRLGIVDRTKTPLTVDQLRFIEQFYKDPKNKMMNNDMFEFFNRITDRDAFVKWANNPQNVLGVAPYVLGGSTLGVLLQNNQSEQ